MHFKLFLLILFAPATLFTAAQKPIRKGVTVNTPAKKEPVAKYSINQLNGKWQEIKRMNAKNKKVLDFSDTLLLIFEKGKVEMKDATSMRMTVKGEAEIEAPNSLTVAGDVYSIESLKDDKLMLNDGEFLRLMQKKEQLYFETVGKTIVEKDSFPKPVDIDLNNLKGKWLVYSRKAEPGVVKKETAVIKSITVKNVTADGIAFGEIVFYTSDVSISASCQLVTKNGSIKIVSEKNTWMLYAYKLANEEFVFGDTASLLYFSKRL